MILFIRKIFTVIVKNLHVYQSKKGKVIFVTFLVVTLVQSVYAQDNSKENIEFLSQDSYENLSAAYEESKDNNTIAKPFAEAFLLKAKWTKDTLKQVEGYFKIANVLTDNSRAKKYLDSVIYITKENYTNKFPAEAYILKAQLNGSQANYTEAMDNLGSANSYANKTHNLDQQYQIKYFIALLKNNIGEYEESMYLLKETLDYLETKYLEDKNYNRLYIKSLYAVGNQFNTLGQPDSSLFHIKKAIRISLKTKRTFLYDRLVFTSAISYKLKSEYTASLDSLKKYEVIAQGIGTSLGTKIRVNCSFGDIYTKLGEREIALPYLKKVDSLVFSYNYFAADIRSSYEHLIEYYKEKKNQKQQLFYINRLLKIDSISNKDVTYLSKSLNYQYETPNLLIKKEELIKGLEKKNSKGEIILVLLSILSLILVLLLIWKHRKQKIYKKRFLELLNATKQVEKTSEENNTNQLIAKRPEDIGVPETIVNDILEYLQKFEQNKGFLDDDISVASLSKKFKTNSKYFSKVVNTYKNKSFSTYINELRIYYSIEQLKVNSKFRKYTIKAIANEIGFNTTEAFSKSFYKTTGIYPSFFIKQLEKQEFAG